MKSFGKFGVLFVLALASVSSLVSCGSETSDDELTIGMECNYAPFNWTQTTNNDYSLPISNHAGFYCDGYDIQMAKKLGDFTGKKVTIVQTQWESLIADLQNGTINAIIAGMTDTAEREESIDFTNEYYRSELVLVAQKSVASKYNTPLSSEEFTALIKGKMLVSQINTVTNNVIESKLVPLGAIHNTPVSTFAVAAQDVISGSAFAMTAEYPVAESIVATSSSLGIIRMDQSIMGDSLKELGVSIGLKKGSTLKEPLNEALAKVDQESRNTLMSEAVSRSASSI